MFTWGSQLHKYRSFHINAWLCAYMLDATLPMIAQIIKTQRIHFRINDLKQVILQLP